MRTYLQKKHKGMSLVEMIVAIGIFSLGIFGFTLLFMRSWRANSFILETGQNSMMAARGVDGAVRIMREARISDTGEYPLQSGDDNDVVFFADYDLDDTVERVHFYLDGEEFKMGITKPTGTPLAYPAGDSSTQLIVNWVANTSEQPVFYYYNNAFPIDIENNALTTPVDVSNVRLMKINLWINTKPLVAPENINLESFVELRNLNSYE